MEKYVVTGGAVLKGEVTISGAKNAVVAIIPATVLARDVCVIENIHNISDVTALLNILRDLGAKVRLLDKTTVEIDTTHIGEPVVSHELAKPLRASYYFLGSLLGRCGRADVSLPGGCNFGGVRPIDQHIKGFKALGADVSVNYGMVTMEDLLETIVGNIQDEYDKEENEYQKLSDTEYIIDGWISVDEVEDLLGIKIPDDTEYDTLGGVVVDMLGDLPEEGQHPSVQIDRVRFTVLEVDDRRISRLKAEILPDESYPEPGERRD